MTHARALLTRASLRRGEDGAGLIHALDQALEQITQAQTIPELMGHEGNAARIWFEGFRLLLREEIPFDGRNRRPPRDPVNAMLSLIYTLVGTELTGRMVVEGLDVNLGFLHGFRYGRLSLGQDLLEEFRQPIVDRWVLTLFNTRQIQADEFTISDEEGCRLEPLAFRKVLKLYTQMLGDAMTPGTWRHRMGQRVAVLRDVVLDGSTLPPFPWSGEGAS